MSSFTASDGEMDYDDHAHGGSAIERFCWDCGRSVWVSPREEYTLQVFCVACQSWDGDGEPAGVQGASAQFRAAEPERPVAVLDPKEAR